MTCRDIDEILSTANDGARLPREAREHVDTCGACRALVSATNLEIAAAVDPVVLERIRGPILSTASRVRPLSSTAFYAAGFLAILFAIAFLGAAIFGIHGPQALGAARTIAIFGVLAVLAVLAAVAVARDMRPGARTIRGPVIFAVAIAAIEALFFVMFQDYTMGRFVQSGMGCFTAGLLCALPPAILVAIIVRTGYAVAPVSTGGAIGALAGIAGLTMLELHCPILTIPHVAIWHAGVLVLSIGFGALAGWIFRFR